MPGDYDPNEGHFGFQEYQGSPREENIEGEPRFFRTFYGPSETRHAFLISMFGSSAIFIPPIGPSPVCTRICSSPKFYPLEAWQCLSPLNPDFPQFPFNVGPMYQLWPVSYRCEAWDSNRAGTIPTESTVLLGVAQNIECGVLIEIEYRPGFLAWPPSIHDPEFESELNNPNQGSEETPLGEEPFYGPDVPYISTPTFATISHEFSLEAKTIKGRTFEVCSYGTGTTTPDNSAPGKGNQVTSDDVEPVVAINYHKFVVTMHNVPDVGLATARSIIGYVNNDVWFGYPAHAVFCSEISPTPRYHPSNQLHYDIDYTFIAKWSPRNGEAIGDVTPVFASDGTFIHNDMIGIWNRVWWEHAIKDTTQHWWPVTEHGESLATAAEPWADRKLPIPDINFHLGFNWWKNICVDVEPEP